MVYFRLVILGYDLLPYEPSSCRHDHLELGLRNFINGIGSMEFHLVIFHMNLHPAIDPMEPLHLLY